MKPDDIELINKIKIGDKQALEVLIDKYLPQLYAFYKYLRVNEAEIDDLIQDTFIKLMDKLDLYDETKKFSTWLLTIAKNIFIDQCRKETRRAEIRKEVVVEIEPIVSVEASIVDKQTTEEILKNLTPDERLLVELRVFQGVPFAEIAEITGELDTTLRSKFFRILSKLRRKAK